MRNAIDALNKRRGTLEDIIEALKRPDEERAELAELDKVIKILELLDDSPELTKVVESAYEIKEYVRENATDPYPSRALRVAIRDRGYKALNDLRAHWIHEVGP